MNEEAKKRFRIRLIELDMNQVELARRVGVTKGMITHLIKGRKQTKYLQDAIAEILQVESNELWS